MKSILEDIKEFCESIEDPFLSGVYQVLLEADVQWLNTQAYIVSQLIDNPQAENYGLKNVKGWESLNNNQKTSEMFKYFAKVGALEDVRKYMEASPNVLPGPTPMHYDVPEVEEPYTGNSAVHWEQFKKSKVFSDLSLIFLNYL